MMFVNMADVPSFSTKVMSMGKSNTVPMGTKQAIGSTTRVFGRESGKANALAASSASSSNAFAAKGLMLPPPAPLQTRKDPFGDMEMLPAGSVARAGVQIKKARPSSSTSSKRSSAGSGKMLFRPSPTRVEVSPHSTIPYLNLD